MLVEGRTQLRLEVALAQDAQAERLEVGGGRDSGVRCRRRHRGTRVGDPQFPGRHRGRFRRPVKRVSIARHDGRSPRSDARGPRPAHHRHDHRAGGAGWLRGGPAAGRGGSRRGRDGHAVSTFPQQGRPARGGARARDPRDGRGGGGAAAEGRHAERAGRRLLRDGDARDAASAEPVTGDAARLGGGGARAGREGRDLSRPDAADDRRCAARRTDPGGRRFDERSRAIARGSAQPDLVCGHDGMVVRTADADDHQRTNARLGRAGARREAGTVS